MDIVFLFLRGFCFYALGALMLCMMVRAVLSWIPDLNESKLGYFAQLLTEPFISPVRRLLLRLFPRLAEFPLDLSFFVTMLLIMLLQTLVS